MKSNRFTIIEIDDVSNYPMDNFAIGYYSTSGSPSCWTEFYQINGTLQEVANSLQNMIDEIDEYNYFVELESNGWRRQIECYIKVFNK